MNLNKLVGLANIRAKEYNHFTAELVDLNIREQKVIHSFDKLIQKKLKQNDFLKFLISYYYYAIKDEEQECIVRD